MLVRPVSTDWTVAKSEVWRMRIEPLESVRITSVLSGLNELDDEGRRESQRIHDVRVVGVSVFV